MLGRGLPAEFRSVISVLGAVLDALVVVRTNDKGHAGDRGMGLMMLQRRRDDESLNQKTRGRNVCPGPLASCVYSLCMEIMVDCSGGTP